MPEQFGMLTIGNIEQVAKKIKKKLKGQKYTFVAVNAYFSHPDPLDEQGFLLSTNAPEVRTSQELTGDVSIWFDKENDPPRYAGFNFNDTYGVWGLSTSTNNPNYDYEFKNPYFVIEYKTIRFYHRAPAGHFLAWVIAIEE